MTWSFTPWSRIRGYSGTLLVLSLIACTSPTPSPLSKLPEFVPESSLGTSGEVGCSALVSSYCDSLFSPEAQGNLQIGRKGDAFSVYRGKTSNDFNATYFFYANAKLKRKQELPQDFRTALDQQSYFALLKIYLSRPPREQMSPSERAADLRAHHRLQSIWNAAADETIMQRLQRIYPDYHRLPEELIPTEVRWEARRIRRQLISEISMALWKDHDNWKKVEATFENVRGHFIQMIQRLKVDAEIRDRWIRRLREVKLILPGTIPEIADEECSTTDTNAFYYSHLNVITVCAGDFNSEDIYQTIAHELSHAVDSSSMAYQFRMRSRLGRDLAALRKESCDSPTPSCGKWSMMKESFRKRLAEWEDFEVDLPKFQGCLKRTSTHATLTDAVIERSSRAQVNELMAELAGSDTFIRLVKPKLLRPNGKWQPNPRYLNACKVAPGTQEKDPFDEENRLILFFVSEYRCSSGSPEAKLRHSIEVARKMATDLTRAEIRMLGDLSSDDWLVKNGYASSPDERFADVLGSHVLAQVLREVPDRWSRRKQYLASSSWQCDAPSLATVFPGEARIQRELTFGSHSAGRERQRESLSEPVREALGCEKDFEFEECRLEDEEEE